MRKIFLTSGLVLCMACPAFADLGPTNHIMTGNPATESNDPASCQYPTLEGYTGTSTFTAIWTANPYKITYYPGVATAPLVASNPHTVSGTATDQQVTFDANVTLKSNTASDLTGGAWAQTGYSFDGWRSDHEILSNASTPALTDNNTAGGAATYTEGATHYNGNQLKYKVPGDTKMYAIWNPNKSGKITLDSSVYPSNNTGATAKYTTSTGVTAVSPDEVFSIYETALYDWAEGQTSAPAALTQFTPPTKTGYTFGGFYEADGTTQVITNAGAIVEAAALRSVSAVNGTKIWYAHWTADPVTIHYTCGLVPATASTGTPGNAVGGTAPSDSSNLTYDGAWSLSADAGGCALNGYHFVGWECNKDLATGEDNQEYAATCGSGANINTCTVSASGQTAKWTGTVTCNAKWAANTIGTNFVLGTGATATQDGGTTCTYDGAITLPQGVTKTGYTFGGWTVTNP